MKRGPGDLTWPDLWLKFSQDVRNRFPKGYWKTAALRAIIFALSIKSLRGAVISPPAGRGLSILVANIFSFVAKYFAQKSNDDCCVEKIEIKVNFRASFVFYPYSYPKVKMTVRRDQFWTLSWPKLTAFGHFGGKIVIFRWPKNSPEKRNYGCCMEKIELEKKSERTPRP